MSEAATRICPDCGAHTAPEASFCGRCGHVLLENLGVVPSEDSPTFDSEALQQRPEMSLSQDDWLIPAPDDLEIASSSSDNLKDMQAAAQSQVNLETQKRCAWCNGLSPWDTVVCEVCGARFPVPGQDAAFKRAAEERMRQEEESLDFWRQRRRRGWRRFLI